MFIRFSSKLAALAGAALVLGACGGGGSNAFRPQPTPTPTPTPPPPPPPAAPAVVIFSEPVPQDYAVVGVSANAGSFTAPPYDVDFTPATSAESSQPRIRYTSAGTYEVQLPGSGYAQVIHDPAVPNPTSANTIFRLQSQASASLVTTGSYNRGYLYSEVAKWSRPDLDFAYTTDLGYFAFGTPTPAGGVPVAGNASFQGDVFGITDLRNGLCDCSNFPAEVEGSVALNFNFGTGTLGGSMSIALSSGWGPVALGNYQFVQTVYSTGSSTYSGRFGTSLSGDNFFLGRFTGPNAQETIGAWAVPFQYSEGTYQAIGAWIAKRGQ